VKKSEKLMSATVGVLLLVLGYLYIPGMTRKGRASTLSPFPGPSADVNVNETQCLDYSLLPVEGSLPIADMKRDPFHVPPPKAAINEAATERVEPVFRLRGVLGGLSEKYALINDRVVAIGDTVDGMEVLEIHEDRVTLANGNNKFIVRMHSALKGDDTVPSENTMRSPPGVDTTQGGTSRSSSLRK
jgi:hypothetical protein